MNREFRIAAGTAVVAGLLDFLFVRIWWNDAGVSLMRIAQSVAAGVLGDRAFEGGAGSALLGTALHLVIFVAFVWAYVRASVRWPALRRNPFLGALLYGLATFALMNFVVVPLSAASAVMRINAWFFASLMAHVVLVGGASAWAARRVHGD